MCVCACVCKMSVCDMCVCVCACVCVCKMYVCDMCVCMMSVRVCEAVSTHNLKCVREVCE